ncbi:hypothetical protein [Profundibacter sp.]|uniref:hypothetical protein n=1 Tax=Profundibacter sp. TaxID=3101071 RepID=UPI003D0984FE
MIRSNQAGQAKNRPPRREEGENGNLQRFPIDGNSHGCVSKVVEIDFRHLRAG